MGSPEQKFIWLSSSIIEFPANIQTRRLEDEKFLLEHYEIWQHADDLLRQGHDRQSLASCLFQLNRVVDFRDNLLNTHYRFKKIPGQEKKERHKILENVGLVKPVMRERLDKLRNRLMHTQEENAPSLKECIILSEFVWYYLKSTDRFVAHPIEEVIFEIDDVNWVEINLSNPWDLLLRGNVPAELTSFEGGEGWVQVDLQKGIPYEGIRLVEQENNKFFYIYGTVSDKNNFIINFTKRIFELY